MAKQYGPTSTEMTDVLCEVRTEHHSDLSALCIRMVAIFSDNATPAMVHRGRPVAANVRVLARQDAVATGVDVVMCVNGDWWKLASEEQRLAVIDHELSHLVVDDNDRVKLVEHEFAVEGFYDVIQRHGRHALEYQGVAGVCQHGGQELFPFMGVITNALNAAPVRIAEVG